MEKPIPGFDGWVVSDEGVLRRLRDNFTPSCPKTEKGYRVVFINRNGFYGKYDRLFVHRLVLRAFYGEAPRGMMCRHLNGNPEDNRLSNLAWGTAKQNTADRMAHGRIPGQRGEAHAKAKLKAVDVAEIRGSKLNHTEIAKKFGISPGHVCGIRKGYYWRSAPFAGDDSFPPCQRRSYVPPCRRPPPLLTDSPEK